MSLRILLVLGLLAAPAAAAEVHVVIGYELGDEGVVQAAVDAAADGDVLLIQPFTPFGIPVYDVYDGIEIDGKGLTLIGVDDLHANPAPPAASRLRSVTVRNLAPDQVVVLRHLEVSAHVEQVVGTDQNEGPALRVLDCNGAVRVEDGWLTGENGWPLPTPESQPEPAVLAVAAADVVLTRCRLVGGVGGSILGADDELTTPGAAALSATKSALVLHDGTLLGGDGGRVAVASCAGAGDGGSGVVANDASVLLAGCTVTGGAGGDANAGEDPATGQPCGGAAGSGGDGLVQLGSVLRQRGTSLAGGPPGAYVRGLGQPGTPGMDVVQLGGELSALSGLPRDTLAAATGIEGRGSSLEVSGLGGDAVTLWIADRPAQPWLPGPEQALLVGLPLLAPPLPVGILPGPPSLRTSVALPVTLPWLPVGTDARVLHLQAVLAGIDGIHAGSTTALTILDEAFSSASGRAPRPRNRSPP